MATAKVTALSRFAIRRAAAICEIILRNCSDQFLGNLCTARRRRNSIGDTDEKLPGSVQINLKSITGKDLPSKAVHCVNVDRFVDEFVSSSSINPKRGIRYRELPRALTQATEPHGPHTVAHVLDPAQTALRPPVSVRCPAAHLPVSKPHTHFQSA